MKAVLCHEYPIMKRVSTYNMIVYDNKLFVSVCNLPNCMLVYFRIKPEKDKEREKNDQETKEDRVLVGSYQSFQGFQKGNSISLMILTSRNILMVHQSIDLYAVCCPRAEEMPVRILSDVYSSLILIDNCFYYSSRSGHLVIIKARMGKMNFARLKKSVIHYNLHNKIIEKGRIVGRLIKNHLIMVLNESSKSARVYIIDGARKKIIIDLSSFLQTSECSITISCPGDSKPSFDEEMSDDNAVNEEEQRNTKPRTNWIIVFKSYEEDRSKNASLVVFDKNSIIKSRKNFLTCSLPIHSTRRLKSIITKIYGLEYLFLMTSFSLHIFSINSEHLGLISSSPLGNHCSDMIMIERFLMVSDWSSSCVRQYKVDPGPSKPDYLQYDLESLFHNDLNHKLIIDQMHSKYEDIV